MTLAFRNLPHPQRAAVPDSSAGPETFIERKRVILIVLLVLTRLLPNYLVQSGPYWVKVAVWGGLTLITATYAWRTIDREQLRQWMQESWWFVRIIFPLLLGGVFVVGVVGYLLPEEWIREWLGGNGLTANFLATVIGSVSYFATMTEAPSVDTLMGLGMGKGPALTLFLTGPGLSLPNWLAIARVFGIRQALVYVPTIIVLGTVIGWLFGNFVF